ncbi:biotin/lipoyl-binding protein [Hankyongella ginsenosidimutans]|uniref:Biotin/lipoyl-binding protein n=1 Tax=Hankyongella ginsenosidimutans TaxID=1763828 RepID=A0A4D7BWY4_9SPHN|nr:biotin/lipoyl-binding protein [Hankyongella ginsenosidimutans]
MAHHWRVLRDAWALERARVRRAWRETDFLPAALEVVETPPNPLGRAILWVLMGFVVLALAWSVLARLDVVAVAPAKVIAVGRNKLVQAADVGVVRAIHVRDGQHVTKGQPLLTLDPTSTGAERAQARAQLEQAAMDAARNRALLAVLSGKPPAFVPPAGAAPRWSPCRSS